MEEVKGGSSDLDLLKLSAIQIVQFLKLNEELLFVQFNDLFKEKSLDIIPNSWYDSLRSEVTSIKDLFTEIKPGWPEDLCSFISKAQELLEKVPRRKPEYHVDAKSKKDHEVTILADFIQNEILLKDMQSHIVDVGCGKGYLSFEIGERIKDNLSITMIDGAEMNVEACRSISEKKGLSKVITQIETKWITPQNYHEIIPQGHNQKQILITGIHQCGDLSSSSMREFARNPSVTDLAVVGCCYNCLSELIDSENLQKHSKAYQRYIESLGIDKNGRCLDDSLVQANGINQKTAGFPLSTFLFEVMNEYHLFLGRSVRNAATVSLKSEKLQSNFPETMTKLYYRAVIQEMIFDKLIPGQYSQKKIKKVLGLSFSEYCLKSLGQTLGELDLIQLQKDYDEQYKNRFEDFKVLYCLKALLSPLVESLIALDRVIFIQESLTQGQQLELCEIVEIFEKSKSTRNFLIHAKKQRPPLIN